MTKEVVEQRMPLITTSLKEMDIESKGTKRVGDKKQAPEPRNINVNDRPTTSYAQPTTCALPLMAFNDLSPQGASIWQQLSSKDKVILIDTTSKQ